MSAPQFRIPPAIGRLLGRLPPQPPAWLFVQGLNRILAPQLPEDVRRALFARRLRLRVEDAGLAIDFSWQGSAFETARHSSARLASTAVCMSASRWAIDWNVPIGLPNCLRSFA